MKNIIILILIIILQQSFMYRITLAHNKKLLKTNKFSNPIQYGPPAISSNNFSSLSTSSSLLQPPVLSSSTTAAPPVSNSTSLAKSSSALPHFYRISLLNHSGTISKSFHIKNVKANHSGSPAHRNSHNPKSHKKSHDKGLDFNLKLNVGGGNDNNYSRFSSTCSIEELTLCAKKCELKKDTVSYCGNSKMIKNQALNGVLIDKHYDCICKNESNKILPDSKNIPFANQPALQAVAKDNNTNQPTFGQPGEIKTNLPQNNYFSNTLPNPSPINNNLLPNNAITSNQLNFTPSTNAQNQQNPATINTGNLPNNQNTSILQGQAPQNFVANPLVGQINPNSPSGSLPNNLLPPPPQIVN